MRLIAGKGWHQQSRVFRNYLEQGADYRIIAIIHLWLIVHLILGFRKLRDHRLPLPPNA